MARPSQPWQRILGVLSASGCALWIVLALGIFVALTVRDGLEGLGVAAMTVLLLSFYGPPIIFIAAFCIGFPIALVAVNKGWTSNAHTALFGAITGALTGVILSSWLALETLKETVGGSLVLAAIGLSGGLIARWICGKFKAA